MSIFFKFKSAKDFNSLPMESQFISVGNLKERIFGLKYYGRGNDTDLVFSNAQTNQEYTDEAVLIPRNTSVLIRRVPGRPRMRTVATLEEVKAIEDSTQNLTPDTRNVAAQHSTMNPEESEWDEFGNDPYAIVPEGLPAQSFNPASVSSSDMLDEDSRLRAFLETPSLDWSSFQKDQPRGRGYGQGIGGRMLGGRGFGRGLFENRNPPPGYVCHRCNIDGHFIQYCPTNGDPAYDLRRFKPPTGIPKSIPSMSREAMVSSDLLQENGVLTKHVLVQEKVLWILLNKNDSMQKFMIQHMLDFGLLLQILQFTCLFFFLSCNFVIVLYLIL